MAIEAGPLDPFNHSFSIMVECDTQAEIDRLWDALKEGGTDRAMRLAEGPLGPLLADRAQAAGRADAAIPTVTRSKRVAEAMLKMVKFDIAGLEAAARK